MKIAVVLAALFLMMLPMTAARSKEEVFERITAPRMATIMKNAGYRAELVRNKSGKEHIKTSLVGYKNAAVYFYGCKDNGCISVQFYIGFIKEARFTLEYVNRWNQTKRYAYKFLDRDGDLVMVYDVSLEGGVTEKFVLEQFFLFESLLSQSKNFD